MKKAESVLRESRRLAGTCASWSDFSNALFDPVDGIVTWTYPTREQRAAFAKTPEYEEILKLLTAAMEASGVIEGATPKKSGKFVVRLPSSLHAALEREAHREGVSLNQLVLAKLAVQLGATVTHA
jgi:hypothetical protein